MADPRYAWLTRPNAPPTCVRVLGAGYRRGVLVDLCGVRVTVETRHLRQYRAGCRRLAEGRGMGRWSCALTPPSPTCSRR